MILALYTSATGLAAQQLVVDKGATPWLHAHQAIGLQRGNCLAQGVAVHTEATRQLAFTWQATSGAESAVANFGAERVGNLFPDRYPAAPTGCGGKAVLACHHLVMLPG